MSFDVEVRQHLQIELHVVSHLDPMRQLQDFGDHPENILQGQFAMGFMDRHVVGVTRAERKTKADRNVAHTIETRGLGVKTESLSL